MKVHWSYDAAMAIINPYSRAGWELLVRLTDGYEL